MGATCFPECLKYSGKSQKHSGKPSLSATLGEELPRTRFTGKRSSPSAKNRTLGEGFPECLGSTQGRFNAVGLVHFFLTLPRVFHSGKKFNFFLKPSSPSATLGEAPLCFFFIFCFLCDQQSIYIYTYIHTHTHIYIERERHTQISHKSRSIYHKPQF
jgi:hypothetical protein